MPWDPAPATTACQPSGSATSAEGRDLQVAVAEFCACAPCLLRKIAPQSVRLVCRWDDGDKQSLKGWFCAPHSKSPWPLVVMAHGFSATRHMTADKYAKVFQAAGLLYCSTIIEASGSEDPEDITDIEKLKHIFGV